MIGVSVAVTAVAALAGLADVPIAVNYARATASTITGSLIEGGTVTLGDDSTWTADGVAATVTEREYRFVFDGVPQDWQTALVFDLVLVDAGTPYVLQERAEITGAFRNPATIQSGTIGAAQGSTPSVLLLSDILGGAGEINIDFDGPITIEGGVEEIIIRQGTGEDEVSYRITGIAPGDYSIVNEATDATATITVTAPAPVIEVTDEPSLAGIGAIRAGDTPTRIIDRMTDLGAATTSGTGSVTIAGEVLVGGNVVGANVGLAQGDEATIRVTYSASGAADVVRDLGPVTVTAATPNPTNLYQSLVNMANPGVIGRRTSGVNPRIDIANLPVGVTWDENLQQLIINGDDLTFTGVDFRGYYTRFAGSNIVADDCDFGFHPDGPNTGLYDVQFMDTARNVRVMNSTVDSGGWEGRGLAMHWQGIPGVTNAPEDIEVVNVAFINTPGDAAKPGGYRCAMRRILIDNPSQVPPNTTYYSSTTDYEVGDSVLFQVNEDTHRLYTALVPIAAGTNPPSGGTVNDDFWSVRDYHWDGLQPAAYVDLVLEDFFIRGRINPDNLPVQPATNVTSALRFNPRTNRPRSFINCNISGMVIADPWDGNTPVTFEDNIREWESGIEYKRPGLGANDQIYCLRQNVQFVCLVDSSLNVDPIGNPLEWAPVRDIGMDGRTFAEHVWVGTGKGGSVGFFSDRSVGRGIARDTVRLDRDGSIMSQPDFTVVLDRPEPVYGQPREPMPEQGSTFGPSSGYELVPTQNVDVIIDNAIRSGFPVYVGGQPLGLIPADGSDPIIANGAGITLSESAPGVYQLDIFDHLGEPMTATMSVLYGGADVTATGASAQVGPAWGVVDETPANLSVSITRSSETTATLSFTTDEPNVTVRWVVTNSTTTPSIQQIEAGFDHSGLPAIAHSTDTRAVPGTYTGSVSGQEPNSELFLYAYSRDASGNEGMIVSDSAVLTASGNLVDTSTAVRQAPALERSYDPAGGGTLTSVLTDDTSIITFDFIGTVDLPAGNYTASAVVTVDRSTQFKLVTANNRFLSSGATDATVILTPTNEGVPETFVVSETINLPNGLLNSSGTTGYAGYMFEHLGTVDGSITVADFSLTAD